MTDRLPQVFDRATAIAEALADAPRSFGELSTALGDLAAPTLARLLRALARAGLVAKDGRAYAIGPRLGAMARRVAGMTDPAALLGPVLADLARATGDSAACYAWREHGVVLLATHEVPESFHYMAVGGVVPELTRHGFCQAMVATLPPARQRWCWRRCPERRRRRLSAFLARCADIRRQGHAIERGEHLAGVVRIAAAVRHGADGELYGAIGVSALGRDDAELRLRLAAVRRAAAAASLLLGRLSAPVHPLPPATGSGDASRASSASSAKEAQP
jgi:DNA-binding IclR family transcriptional regulator